MRTASKQGSSPNKQHLCFILSVFPLDFTRGAFCPALNVCTEPRVSRRDSCLRKTGSSLRAKQGEPLGYAEVVEWAMLKASRSTMLSAGASNNKVKYSRLAADEDGYIDLQFKRSPPKVPYKAIALALFLFLIGSLLITFGALLLSGTIEVEHPDRTIPVIIIGVLVFLPGFYHLRIAYYASKGGAVRLHKLLLL
uniref:Transmembrane protein 230 n=1 Tax=Knipowitschia caucasica TaxID=637954 RepID=A0AAV2IWP1_KNICA